MLQTCDVGHRVVIRRRLTGRPRFTDVLGVLVALDGEGLVVRTEDGTEHAMALDEVEAAKRVPPRPAKYSEIIALERVADRAWPAPTTEPLGAWLLRAADGWTNRANSALPLGEADRPLGAAVAAVAAFYRDRGLPPKITVPLPVRRDVADHLGAAGWIRQPTVLVQSAPIEGLSGEHPPPDAAPVVGRPGDGSADGVILAATPSAEFLAIIAARKASLPAAAHRVLLDAPAVRFAEIREGGELLAITRGAVVDRWLHLGLVEVMPAARRRGLARRAGAALARWASGHGATRAVLQVEEHNEAAVTLYGRQGFTTHHTYATYRLDA